MQVLKVANKKKERGEEIGGLKFKRPIDKKREGYINNRRIRLPVKQELEI